MAEIHIQSWRQAYRSLLSNDVLAQRGVDPCETMWRETLTAGSPQLLVAHCGGERVGFIAYGPARDVDAGDRCAEVWALYLHPDRWGQGLGRRPWLAALVGMRSSGFTAAVLWVVVGNARAIGFYEAMGCRAEAQFKQARRGDAVLDEQRYRCAVGPQA